MPVYIPSLLSLFLGLLFLLPVHITEISTMIWFPCLSYFALDWLQTSLITQMYPAHRNTSNFSSCPSTPDAPAGSAAGCTSQQSHVFCSPHTVLGLFRIYLIMFIISLPLKRENLSFKDVKETAASYMVVLSDGFSETLAGWENRGVSWFGSGRGVHKDRMIYLYFSWVASVHLSGVIGTRLVNSPVWASIHTDYIWMKLLIDNIANQGALIT